MPNVKRLVKDSQIRLMISIAVSNVNGRLARATEARLQRQDFLHNIKAMAHKGKIAVIWGGRDCDGVQYSGNVHIVDATVQAVDDEIRHTYEWADGPCDYYLAHPLDAQRVEYTSRDLTLEAFEDGHPHCIYSEY